MQWLYHAKLLVTPQFGPRVSLATVLTSAEMACGAPIANRCGTCTRCIDACPQGALRPACFGDHPAGVEDALAVEACGAQIEATWLAGTHCYTCMLACPYA